MYTTCLFCHSPLGTNEVVEHFPVGRRLAYDPARGRLWVVCPSCRQWCLTPIEERWEAIEEAERLFRGTKLRASTDQVGLARMRDGSELVRIGEPMRPEFAAWRYGARFGARWRRRAALFTGAGAIVTGYIVAGPVMGLIATGFGTGLYNVSWMTWQALQRRRVIARLSLPSGVAAITEVHLWGARVMDAPDAPGGWALRLPHRAEDVAVGRFLRRAAKATDAETVLTGADAVAAAREVLPTLNAWGGRRDTVAEAVLLLEVAGTVDANFARVARSGGIHGPTVLHQLKAAQRLALEMAVHEEVERRALDGELYLLEEAWKEAEEVAAIADELTLPERIGARLARLRG